MKAFREILSKIFIGLAIAAACAASAAVMKVNTLEKEMDYNKSDHFRMESKIDFIIKKLLEH